MNVHAASPSPLSPAAVERYRSDGYLVVPDLLAHEEVDRFLAGAAEPPPPERRAGLRTHTVDPDWMRLAAHPRVAAIVRQLLEGEPRIVQTMFLDKPPAGAQGIALHQDTYYLPNEPNTLMACWLALTDTSPENGGLCVVPGSHRAGLRGSHPNRNGEEHAVWENEHTFRDRDGREWTHQLWAAEIDDLDPSEIVRLTIPRGGGVFFTGLTIHGSFANRSGDRRRAAFATHYVRAGTWLSRTDVQETVPLPAQPPATEGAG